MQEIYSLSIHGNSIQIGLFDILVWHRSTFAQLFGNIGEIQILGSYESANCIFPYCTGFSFWDNYALLHNSTYLDGIKLIYRS